MLFERKKIIGRRLHIEGANAGLLRTRKSENNNTITKEGRNIL